MKEFREGLSQCHRWYSKTVEVNTGLMASILFPSASNVASSAAAVMRSDSQDRPVQPGCNYWNQPAPHRTRLSPNFPFYMETVRLAEYQRYLGPESARKNKDWNLYTWTLLQHALGGEEALLKKLLHLRKDGRLLSDVVDSTLKQAIFGIDMIQVIPGYYASTRGSICQRNNTLFCL